MTPNNPFGIEPSLWVKIQNMRLLDDLLMQTALDGCVPAVELILRIILDQPDLTVTELTVQKILPHMASRELWLDVKAVDAQGKHYNIEVQRSDSGALPKRPRYHSALMDVQVLKKGMDTEDLPETYVIFITENDCLEGGLPLYHIDRVVLETGKLFGDQAHIIYANGAYQGDDPMGRLMSDFRSADPDKMHFPVLAERIREVKSNQKGVTEMSRVLKEIYQEGMEKGIEKGMEKGMATLLQQMMSRQGWTLEHAMEFVGLSLDRKEAYQGQIRALQV